MDSVKDTDSEIKFTVRLSNLVLMGTRKQFTEALKLAIKLEKQEYKNVKIGVVHNGIERFI